MNTKTDPSSFSLLHTKRYGLFWLSSLLSNIGTWMQQVAQPWVILSISHSSFLVGLDSFMLNAPGWIFTLWGGVIADRMDRKKIILTCQSIQLVCILILLALLVSGNLQVWMIILISFFVGTTDSLSMPSFQSIIPSIVSQKDIPRAIALNSTQFNLSRMLGPAIAGILMARLGAVACFGANAFSYIPFFISLAWIYPKGNLQTQPEPVPNELVPLTNVQEFKKLLSKPDVRFPLMTIFVTSLFCSPLITFCPVLIKDIFHAEVGEFGGALAAFGLGGLLGAGILLLPLPLKYGSGRMAAAVAILLGSIMIAIALNRSLLMLSFLMVFAGVTLTFSNISASSFLQKKANNHTRGKVVSLFQLALQAGVSGGGLLTGFAASQLGISTVLFLNGVVAIVLQILILLTGGRTPKKTLPR